MSETDRKRLERMIEVHKIFAPGVLAIARHNQADLAVLKKLLILWNAVGAYINDESDQQYITWDEMHDAYTNLEETE